MAAKYTGIDMEQNYVTVTLCIVIPHMQRRNLTVKNVLKSLKYNISIILLCRYA